MTDESFQRADTAELLANWHEGDSQALARLVELHLPFLRREVDQRLGQQLRQQDEPEDLVQSTVRELIEYSPKFEVVHPGQFRALLARIVERVILHRDRWYRQKRRDMSRQAAQGANTQALLGQGAVDATPSAQAAQREETLWIHLGLEMLDPPDREVVVHRIFDERSFSDIAQTLGLSEDAATKRFHRALPKLAACVRELKASSGIRPAP